MQYYLNSFYFMEVVDEENYRKIYIILFAI